MSLNLTDYAFQKLTKAVPKYVPYYKDAGKFSSVPLGWILHVAVGNGSLHNYFSTRPKGARKFSHFWVSKKGVIEQYASIAYIGWAQAEGNSKYWSVETEGHPDEPLTAAQIKALARLHKGFMLASGRNLNKLCKKPGDIGIGTHSMGGSAWGGHACPGAIRGPQRQAVIERARKMTHVIADK